MSLTVFVAAVGLALVHAVTPSLRLLRVTPRSVWLSIAGGVSVAYVFVHLLPELAEGQRHVTRATGGGDEPTSAIALERHVYLVALLGLAAFYGVDKLAVRSRRQRDDARTGAIASARVFWVHMASFALYNALIGYLLLHREEGGTAGLFTFTVAMALHFMVTDTGLHEHHEHRFRDRGRRLLVLALGLGVALGATTALSDAAIAVLLAFVAGGVILNVLKEEVPDERRSRYWAFVLGMAGYAALLLLV